MIKKTITVISLLPMLFAISFANPEVDNTSTEKHATKQVYTQTPAATAVLGPFTAVGIGVASILMIPGGFVKGAIDGFNTPNDMLSDNFIIRPIQKIGATATGAVSGAVSYPMKTSTELTQKARENRYID